MWTRTCRLCLCLVGWCNWVLVRWWLRWKLCRCCAFTTWASQGYIYAIAFAIDEKFVEEKLLAEPSRTNNSASSLRQPRLGPASVQSATVSMTLDKKCHVLTVIEIEAPALNKVSRILRNQFPEAVDDKSNDGGMRCRFMCIFMTYYLLGTIK